MSKIQNFSFWMPAQAIISKAGDGGADKTGKRWIQGIASTAEVDLQGEIVDQHGIDFNYFLKYGYFNDDHKSGPKYKIGQPVEAKITKKGLWVKGYLFKDNEQADEYWKLMNSISSSSSNRRVGFSIQGKVLTRDGNTIKKCWIQDVAVTTAPVNASTWAEVVKSLNAHKWDVSKTVVAQNNPAVPESLEEDVHDQGHDKMKKSLSFSESVAYLQAYHKLPRAAAEAVARVVFQSKGVQI